MQQDPAHWGMVFVSRMPLRPSGSSTMSHSSAALANGGRHHLSACSFTSGNATGNWSTGTVSWAVFKMNNRKRLSPITLSKREAISQLIVMGLFAFAVLF